MALKDFLAPISNFFGSLFGAESNADAVRDTNQMNYALGVQQMNLARYYADHGIQIKADDARRAGVNVNTAMGASTSSPSFNFPGMQAAQNGDLFANAGHSLGQALEAAATNDERAEELGKLAVERARLENDVLRSQISVTKSPGRTPPLPSAIDNSPVPGQGNSNLEIKPATVTASSRKNPGHEAGAINEMHYVKDSKGRVRPIMSSDYKQRSEDDLMSTWDWNIRNRILSWWSGPSKPTFSAGRDRHWEWDVGAQAYVSVPDRKSYGLASPGPTPYNKSYRRK